MIGTRLLLTALVLFLAGVVAGITRPGRHYQGDLPYSIICWACFVAATLLAIAGIWWLP